MSMKLLHININCYFNLNINTFYFSLIQRFIENMKFNVRFEFNRLPMRLQHRACELAIEEGLEHKILFPDRRTVCTEQTSHPVNVQLR